MSQTAWIPEDGYGDRLRRTRARLGLDIREMSAAVMHTRSTYARHEKAIRPQDEPHAERLAALVEYRFGVPAEWLPTGDMSRIAQNDDTMQYQDTNATESDLTPDTDQYRRIFDALPQMLDIGPDSKSRLEVSTEHVHRAA